MDVKNNRILIGIIFLLLAIVSLSQNFIKINYGGLGLVFFGFPFLMLYKTKMKSWSLIIGLYLVYFGVSSQLKLLNIYKLNSILSVCGLFIVPGIIFMILFYQKNKRGVLFPGSFLLWFGIYLILNNIPMLNFVQSGLFFICMGLAFFTTFLLGKDFVAVWIYYLSIVLIVSGFLEIIFDNFFHKNFSFPSNMASVLLISFGIIFLMGKKK